MQPCYHWWRPWALYKVLPNWQRESRLESPILLSFQACLLHVTACADCLEDCGLTPDRLLQRIPVIPFDVSVKDSSAQRASMILSSQDDLPLLCRTTPSPCFQEFVQDFVGESRQGFYVPWYFSWQSVEPLFDLLSVLDACANHAASLAPVRCLRAHVGERGDLGTLVQGDLGVSPRLQ